MDQGLIRVVSLFLKLYPLRSKSRLHSAASAKLLAVMATLQSLASSALAVALIAVALLLYAPAQSADRKGKPAATNAEILPKVYLIYPAPEGTIFDRLCSQFLKGEPPRPEWAQEAVRRVPEFQAQWDKEGPAYLKAVYAEVGAQFPFREMQAALTVCPVDSMSAPLLINVRTYLSTSPQKSPPWGFPLLVFHELMHTYTRWVYDVSAVRKKYASEAAGTLNHLHVLALEKFVLLKLGKTEELKYWDERYRTRAPAAYKRAWEIVNDAEGYEVLIAELKQLRK